MSQFFLKVYQFFQHQGKIGFVILFSILIIFGYFASKITLEEDITRLIPSGGDRDVLKRVLKETQFQDKIIVVVSSKGDQINPDALTQYANQFIDSVNLRLPEYVSDIQGKVPQESVLELYDFVYNNLPLFLNRDDYHTVTNRLTPDTLDVIVRDNFKNIISPTGFVTKEYIFKDPLSITSLGLAKLQELQVGDDFELYNDYVVTSNKQHLLLFITPTLPSSETNKNKIFIEGLNEIQQDLNNENETVSAEFFGGVLYALANANQIKKDIQLTIGIAATLLLIILIFFYRRIYIPIVLFIPSIFGALIAISVLYFVKGTVSAISLGIGAILLGISLDYALHILTHYRNNNDINTLYKSVAKPVLMSSLTTAVAFFCLLFVNSEALQDLGIFAGISVITSSIFALILIPLLYKAPANLQIDKIDIIDRIASYPFHKNKILVGAVFALFLISLLFFNKVDFNNDISSFNYEPEEIKALENRVLNLSGRAQKSVYLVAYGNTLDEALLNNNHLYNRLNFFKNNQTIDNFSSIGGVVLSTDTQIDKIEQWKSFWKEDKKLRLQQNLIEKSAEYGFRPESFNRFYTHLNSDFESLLLDDYQNTSTLYLDDFISTSENFATVLSVINLSEENAGLFLKQFENVNGIVAIDRQQINNSFLGHLKSDFNNLLLYSIIAVFIILLLFYKNLELSIITMLPIGITWIIALGIMSILNIEFNILNIIISTFIFGLGLDYSIFITNASIKAYETGRGELKTYRTSILLSVLTTLLGMGALIFAVHPALRSVSIMSIIGILSAVTVAFVLQPYLFFRFFIKPTQLGLPPFRFVQSFNFYKASKKAYYQNDKLYFKNAVLDNYRYKSVFNEVKMEFTLEKERYLKLSTFIDEKDKILHVYCDYGLLPVYLSYKKTEVEITAVEALEDKLVIAQNTFAAKSTKLDFQSAIPETRDSFNVLIISNVPSTNQDKIFKSLVKNHIKKVIVLDINYASRWIVDLDFEIIYRQNNLLVYKKME